jgi:hypothetical protein
MEALAGSVGVGTALPSIPMRPPGEQAVDVGVAELAPVVSVGVGVGEEVASARVAVRNVEAAAGCGADPVAARRRAPPASVPTPPE